MATNSWWRNVGCVCHPTLATCTKQLVGKLVVVNVVLKVLLLISVMFVAFDIVELCGFSGPFCQRTWRNQLFPFCLSPASVQSKRKSLCAR